MKYSKKLYEAIEFENIRDLLYNTVKTYPNNNAFIVKTKNDGKQVEYKNITYKEFGENINYLGTKLIDLGVNRIAIIGKNSYEWALSSITVLSGVRNNYSTRQRITRSRNRISSSKKLCRCNNIFKRL